MNLDIYTYTRVLLLIPSTRSTVVKKSSCLWNPFVTSLVVALHLEPLLLLHLLLRCTWKPLGGHLEAWLLNCTWRPLGRHLKATWKSLGGHLEATWRPMGRYLEAKWAQEAPSCAQEAPKRPQEGPKRFQEASKR